MQGRAHDRDRPSKTSCPDGPGIHGKEQTDDATCKWQRRAGKLLGCSDSKRGNAVLYQFRADNEPTIDGVRQFEKYLLDDQDVFLPGQLTTKGAEAHNALKRMRAQADRDNASRERKKNRQGK